MAFIPSSSNSVGKRMFPMYTPSGSMLSSILSYHSMFPSHSWSITCILFSLKVIGCSERNHSPGMIISYSPNSSDSSQAIVVSCWRIFNVMKGAKQFPIPLAGDPLKARNVLGSFLSTHCRP